MNINEHFNFLLKEYNLNKLYIKFIVLSLGTTLIIRGFYWVLIVFSEIIKNKPELIQKFSIILLLLFSLNIPCQKMLKETTGIFIKEIKLANTNHFNNKIINMKKNDLLNFNLNEYHIMINSFNDNLEQFILNNKNEFEIPFYFTTLIILAINKKNGLIMGLFAIFYIVIRVFNEIRIIQEKPLINNIMESDKNIRNYISNSKVLLINNELNNEYLTNNVNNFEDSKFKIFQLDNLLDYKANIAMLIFIIILIASKINNLNQSRIIVVGDTPLDILTAQSRNLPIVAMATGNYGIHELDKFKPTLLLSNFKKQPIDFYNFLESINLKKNNL